MAKQNIKTINDEMPQGDKRISLIWIYNLISPGVWLGTIYGSGTSSLRYLAVIWILELIFIQWGLYFILPMFFILSLVSTSAVHEKNEHQMRLERAKRRRLEQSKTNQTESVTEQETEKLDNEEYVDLEFDDILKKAQQEDILDYNPVSKEVRKLLKKDREDKK